MDIDLFNFQLYFVFLSKTDPFEVQLPDPRPHVPETAFVNADRDATSSCSVAKPRCHNNFDLNRETRR